MIMQGETGDLVIKEIGIQDEKDLLVRQIKSSLNPIKELLDDEEITDIYIYGPENISFIRRGCPREMTEIKWTSEKDLWTAIRQLGRYLKRKIDEKNPIMDTRLPDGSRVNVVVNPCFSRGACITIRRFPKMKISADDLVKYGSIEPDGIEILKKLVNQGKNIMISGGTGTGKTTLLNILASYIPENDSIVTIEDAMEIQLNNKYWAAMEKKEAVNEDDNEVSIRDLLKNALRMNPRWVIVGEVRGEEVIDLIRGFNTGHAGISTVHANSCQDALFALEVLMLSHSNQRIEAIRSMLARVVHVVVQLHQSQNYKRRVTEIAQVDGIEYNAGLPEIKLNTLYKCPGELR